MPSINLSALNEVDRHFLNFLLKEQESKSDFDLSLVEASVGPLSAESTWLNKKLERILRVLDSVANLSKEITNCGKLLSDNLTKNISFSDKVTLHTIWSLLNGIVEMHKPLQNIEADFKTAIEIKTEKTCKAEFQFRDGILISEKHEPRPFKSKPLDTRVPHIAYVMNDKSELRISYFFIQLLSNVGRGWVLLWKPNNDGSYKEMFTMEVYIS